MRKILLFLFIAVSFGEVYGQKGIIKGIVKDKITGEEIIGANVIIEGTTIGASTDIYGNFEFAVDPGTYNIIATFIGYTNFNIENLEVAKGEEVTLEIALSEDELQLEEIVIEAKSDASNENILMIERKNSLGLTQAIGSQELSKLLAGTAAEGLKKVVGLSVQGSKFVVVRGLGDRYNNSTLNGFPVASPNPDKRILPYDIFPDDIIDNLSVTKSFSPDLYGDFSGASINIKTKDYPSEQTLSLKMGVQMNTLSTFKDFYTDPSGKDDVIGFNNSREIPYKIIESDAERFTFDSRYYNGQFNENNWFNNSFDENKKNAPLNKSVSLTYGNFLPVYKLSPNAGIGIMLNANYSDGTQLETGKIRMLQNNDGYFRQNFDSDKYIRFVNVSGVGNVTFKLNDDHSVVFNSLYTHISDNSVLITEGDFWDFDRYIYSKRITYKEYELLSLQVNGSHAFFNARLDLDWGFSKSDAKHDEPDRRQVSLRYDPELPENERIYYLNSQDRSETHRFFLSMDDEDKAAKIKGKFAIIPSIDNDDDTDILSVSGGADYRTKTRNSWLRQFNHVLNGSEQFSSTMVDGFLNIQNLNNENYQVIEGTQPMDNNDMELEVIAPYFSLQYQIIPDKLNINAGARYESAKQFIEFAETDDQIQNPDENPLTRNELNTDDFLPGITAKYNFTENLVVIGSYSKTVSRPDFRELAPFEYRESFGAFRNVGNPALQNGYNQNADLRIDKYTKNKGLLSLGLFAKHLDKPIVQNVMAGSNPIRSFQNGDYANVYGVELEMRQNLEPVSSTFKNFTLNANLSLLKSEITIDDGNSGSSTNQTSNTRQLEGASPYLINADLTYTRLLDKMDYSFTMAYNVFGKRLSGIGFLGIGDVYELPYSTLNFSANVNFGPQSKWGVKFSAGNLLNPSIREEQELLDDNGNVSKTVELDNYKKGVTLGLELQYRIF